MTTTDARQSDPAFVDDEEHCAVCGMSAPSAFCHIYREGGRTVSLCSPACAEIFLHRPDQRPAANTGWLAGVGSSDTS